MSIEVTYAGAETWRRVWGNAQIFRRQTFLNEVFPEKISILTPKNSDDFFLVIDQVFLIWLSLFIFSVSLFYQMSYMTLSSQQKALFQQKNSLTTPIFSYLQAFSPIPQHYFSKYWGDQCMGRPPPQIFFGDRPHQSTPRSPPLPEFHVALVWCFIFWLCIGLQCTM